MSLTQGTVVLLLLLMKLCGLGAVYLAGVIVIALLLLYENWLVRADDYSRVNLAFFTLNGVISVVLALLTILDLLLRRPAN